MSQLSPVLQRAIEEALSVNPDATADDFMREIGSAVADSRTRQDIQVAWLRASVIMADLEGGEYTADEVFDAMGQAIEEEAAKAPQPE